MQSASDINNKSLYVISILNQNILSKKEIFLKGISILEIYFIANKN